MTELEKKEYIKMRLNKQLFGMVVDEIEDILSPQTITPIPLSPPEILGSLNLRGRIVTAIDMRTHLRVEGENGKLGDNYRSIVLNHNGELYSLVVDGVSDVIRLADDEISKCPSNLSQRWQDMSGGVYSFEDEIMVILDIEKLMKFTETDEIEED